MNNLNPSRWLLTLYVGVVSTLVCSPAIADLNKPTLPDGTAATDNFFADLKAIIKGNGELVINTAAFIVWIVAAVIVLSSAYESNKRGEWSNFWIAIFIALILVFVGIYFLASGEEILANF